MAFRRVSYVLKAIGIKGIIRTILYGLSRDRLESQFAHQSETLITPQTPGLLIQTNPVDGGIQIEYEHARVEIVFLSPYLIRISWQPGIPPIPYTISDTTWDLQKPIIAKSNNHVTIANQDINLLIDQHGGIRFSDQFNNVFKDDQPPERAGEHWSLSSTLFREEHIYGLGERANLLNLRPGKYTSWNTDVGGTYSRGKDPLYIGTPVYLSLSNFGSYLVYFENSYQSTYQIDDRLIASFSGGMLRYSIIFGSLETIFDQFSKLTGYPFMPPKWSLGYHQSRWSYRSEAEILEVIKGFQEHELPISAIYLDIDYMDGFRVFTTDKAKFPNIKLLAKQLEDKNIKLIASINPAVKVDKKYKLYQDGLSKDVYCKLPDNTIFHGVSWPGWSAFPDFTNPVSRDWWSKQYHSLLDEGISGIWHDMNEPASFAAQGDKSFPSVVQHSLEGRGGEHREAHNIFGLLMDRAGYSALTKQLANKRPWILSRSGWAGMQRYAWNWTGDTETSWESLQQTIPTIIGLSLSGLGFTGVDIGGFSGNPTAELYLRWFQMATFLPFFRTHSAVNTSPREPWVFGESITGIIRKYLELRYSLLPYLYTLSWDASQTGIPPVRPVFWETPADKSLWDIDDEFILGDSMLVAPVVQPGEIHRDVILPSGMWYSFWNDEQFLGAENFNIAGNIQQIPLFIKAGTLLPMESNGQFTLHFYPNTTTKSSCHVYFDRGEGYDKGRLDKFEISPLENSYGISWTSTGEFNFPHKEIRVQVHGFDLFSALVDGINYPITDNSIVTHRFNQLTLSGVSN